MAPVSGHESKVALFDMDGTLVDTETVSTNGITAAIAAFGCECDWELKKKILGKSIKTWPDIIVAERELQGLYPFTVPPCMPHVGEGGIAFGVVGP